MIMRVQFTYNQEELAETTMRLLRRSKPARSWRWKGALYLTLMSWLVILAIYSYIYPNPYFAVIVAVFAAVSSAALYPILYDDAVKKQIRRFNKERFGDIVHQSEIELTPQEIRLRETHYQIAYDWKSVEEIVECEEWVDIFTKAGIVVIRYRAFKSPEERDEFIGLARSYLAAASQSVEPGC